MNMLSSFRRISRATKNEMTVEDPHGEAWIMPDGIGNRRGRPIDFADPDDADLILRAIHVQHVKRGDWQMRRSVRIDQQDPNDDEAIPWANLLPARANSDPLVSLLEREYGYNA